MKLLAVSCLGSFLLTLLPYRRGCCGGSCARLYGRVSEFGAVLRSPQSPRRTLDDLIIPVRGAGLARVRVCLEGVGRGESKISDLSPAVPFSPYMPPASVGA